ncbi:MAG TPA: hypothetical protein VIK77_01785 [Tissierellaceae bacterium]
MWKFYHRYRQKTRKIIGITLCVIGLLIIINFLPIEAILILIGLGLLIMGILILKLK